MELDGIQARLFGVEQREDIRFLAAEDARANDEEVAGRFCIGLGPKLVIEGQRVVKFFQVIYFRAGQREVIEEIAHEILEKLGALGGRYFQVLAARVFRRTSPAKLVNLT